MPENPYTRLKRLSGAAIEKVVNPRRKTALTYVGAKAGEGVAHDLFWMAVAANAAGADLVLTADWEKGALKVETVAKHELSHLPYFLQ